MIARSIAGVAVLLLVAGCSSGASHGAPTPARLSSVIDGRWQYYPPAPARIALSLELWETAGSDTLGGRVVRWMNGDTGLPPEQYGPITGVLSAPRVWFEIPQPAPASPFRIEGTVSGDTLVITSATTAGDENGFAGGRLVRTGPIKR